jgi:hypothetical protein
MLKKHKSKVIKNTFSLFQLKKLIGKKLIVIWKGISITDDLKNNLKKTKEKLIESFKKNKTCSITAMCISGILHVIYGVDILLAIMGISYTDIKKYEIGVCYVEISQYPKLPRDDVHQIIINH